jgi:ornithine decarboxylase
MLAQLGTGFDCASIAEIRQVLDLGVDPSRIIYANPCKASSFIRTASKCGVDLTTFDNADELYKIARNHPRTRLVLRVLVDDSQSRCRFGIKFGAALELVPGLLAKARELDLTVVGASFHVGSGNFGPEIYRDAIQLAAAVFEKGKQAGFDMTLLDVGGGFEDKLFDTAAQVLTEAIEEFFPDRKGMRIIAEPGRYFVSTAFRLATNIIARRGPTLTANNESVQGDGERHAVMCSCLFWVIPRTKADADSRLHQ